MIAYLDQQQQQLLAPGDGGEPQAASDPDAALIFALELQAATADLCNAAADFGGIVHERPTAVILPATSDDVARAVRVAARSARLTVAARGNGHSVAGQAMAKDGLVLDMRALGLPMDLVRVGDYGGGAYADVPGGALWSEVLEWGVGSYGMAPASWTDYLGLTVGGTLSNAGISGQAFRHGPQISNVEELEVVTGDGERRVCSPAVLPDLFYAALGGLGQFGIITRARIPLLPAPLMVKWIRVVYATFEEYSGDSEWLVTRTEPALVDYVEGFVFVNRADSVNGWPSVPIPAGARFDPSLIPADAGPTLYCLEVALHYNHREEDRVDEKVEQALRPLRYVRGLEFAADVSYVDFLSRVNSAEAAASANGTWDAPHPWLNLLIAAANIADFDRKVFRCILRGGIGGPMLVYPLLRTKWDQRTSASVPESEVFYLVALLRFSRPYPEGPPVEDLLAQNREIVEVCRSNGYDFKLYVPHYETQAEWTRHFGHGWPRFLGRKRRYDPMALLAPGQKIFSRAHPPLPGGLQGKSWPSVGARDGVE